MELEVNIKEEPAWLEGTRNASLENIEHVSDMVVLKNEVKSELTEPGSTQENTLEQSEDIKKEIFIEQYTDDQLLAYIKEETRSKQEVSCADHQPPDNGGTYFRCNICGEFFSHKVNLNRHMRTHTRDNKHWCNVCDKSFREEVHLILHMRTHTGEKPHFCNVCSKSYSLKCVLTRHMRNHTGQKPHCCDVCGKSFSQKYHLGDHMRTHTGEKPHLCNVCSKSYSLKGTLTRHMRIHTGQKPHWCNVCGKFFIQKNHLGDHMRTHTGEKPHLCNVCSKSFSLKGTLTCHMRTHMGQKPHRCDVCGKSFSQKIYLRDHMRIHTDSGGGPLGRPPDIGKGAVSKDLHMDVSNTATQRDSSQDAIRDSDQRPHVPVSTYSTTHLGPYIVQCEMDLEVNIKEEPAWLEGTRNASLESIEHLSDMVVLKNEVKSELTEPGSTQENTLE
ncbi:zinc finger protein OZF-like, partial [Anabrus simplex]|uniref:zinc finger protein OZF-like n=1 Tax=Anabrus simplex TaxID=316456 RepID=UPI0035A38031